MDQSKFNKIIDENEEFIYKTYPGEEMMEPIIDIISRFLSEPYPIYTYRYFLNLWPDCTICCYDKKIIKLIFYLFFPSFSSFF